jgi:hypothetical protein
MPAGSSAALGQAVVAASAATSNKTPNHLQFKANSPSTYPLVHPAAAPAMPSKSGNSYQFPVDFISLM